MARVLIMSGTGAHRDPWHAFEATSRRIARVLTGSGHHTALTGRISPGQLDGVDLLLVNTGGFHTGAAEPLADPDSITHFTGRGGALLGMHAAVSLPVEPVDWPGLWGGRWVEGSTHPPIGTARIRVRATDPATDGLTDFTVHDERYSFLRTDDRNTVLAEHTHAGRRHPVAWLRGTAGVRCGVDVLGHGIESFDTPGHRRLLLAMVDRLTTRNGDHR